MDSWNIGNLPQLIKPYMQPPVHLLNMDIFTLKRELKQSKAILIYKSSKEIERANRKQKIKQLKLT